MRIKEFSIRRYGPLPDTGRVVLGKFSLLYGKNEDGKTLTIDALVKLLLQHDSRLFKKIDRVDEDPDGYVIIEVEGGQEVKLPEGGDLPTITDLTPEECCNVFIIRNSELSIGLESDFYRDVTDRLTGLKTKEISSIKNELQEIGKLTRADSSASLRDRGEKLKTRTKDAEDLIGKIKGLEKELKEEEFDKLEEMLLNTKEHISEISSRLELFEDARKREKYEKGKEAYKALMSAQQNLHELEVYSDEDVKLWESFERNIKSWEKDKERLQSEVDTKKRELEQNEVTLKEKKRELEVLRGRKERVDNEIEPERKNYEMGLGKVKSEEARGKFFAAAGIASTVLLLVSIVGLMLNPSPLFYGLFTCFLISTGVSGALRFSFVREKAHLAAVFERIRLAASRFEVAGGNIEEILSNIQKLKEEYSKRESETREADEELSSLKREVKRLQETEIPVLEEKIREAAQEIQDLTQKSGANTLQEYSEKLQSKRGYEKLSETQCGILRSHFGSRGENWEENLSYWANEIKTLEEFEHKAKEITYDEGAVSRLKIDREALLREKQGLESKTAKFSEKLREIERAANNILQLKDDCLYCATSVDLKMVKDKLSEFINEIETEKTNALAAIWVFERLEEKEEQKISGLFGKDSRVSRYFQEITDGIYQEVDFVLEDVKGIRVRLQNGNTLAADKLSGGAYDQLYLSIRLALGEKLLKGAKGFFILDDPFIKADEERLQHQIDILRRVSKSGWQILYFTAKKEIRDALKQDIEAGNVGYVKLQSIFS